MAFRSPASIDTLSGSGFTVTGEDNSNLVAKYNYINNTTRHCLHQLFLRLLRQIMNSKDINMVTNDPEHPDKGKQLKYMS